MFDLKPKQALGERSANIQSPVKSPSKIPLPPSPVTVKKYDMAKVPQIPFARQEGAMSQIFNESKESDKPILVRKIAIAHDAGQTYVSPSDNIMSPTTQKLSDVKGRRFGNFKKSTPVYNPKALFTRPNDTPHST